MEEIKRLIPCADDAVILNWPDAERIEDVDAEDTWVWAGFVKPGRHTVVI